MSTLIEIKKGLPRALRRTRIKGSLGSVTPSEAARNRAYLERRDRLKAGKGTFRDQYAAERTTAAWHGQHATNSATRTLGGESREKSRAALEQSIPAKVIQRKNALEVEGKRFSAPNRRLRWDQRMKLQDYRASQVGKAWEANKPPASAPFFKTSPGSIPGDWKRAEYGRDGTKAARKAKIIRGAKIGGGAAAGAASLAGAGVMAARALRKPVAQQASAVSGKTIAAVGGGSVVAGTGGGLVLRKRKKEQD